MPFEWAFLLDAFQAERDQGITIDTTQIRFRTASRPYVIIDAPGHKEFLKNMITGAASADAALLVIDAVEGMREQSRRHGYMLHLLGVRQVAVVVNKMDLAGYAETRFRAVEAELRGYLAAIGVTAGAVIPVSAREGDGIAGHSPRMPWYTGPTVVEALDGFAAPPAPVERPLRFSIQDVYKFDHRRIVAGRIETGRLAVGDTLLFSPGERRARVATIEAWGAAAPPQSAAAGQSVGVTLDEEIFVERGQIASHLEQAPLETSQFAARLFWLGSQPLRRGDRLTMKLLTAAFPVEISRIERVVDAADLSAASTEEIERNAVAEVVLRVRARVALDAFADDPRTGRFVLVRDYRIVGGGIVSAEGLVDQRRSLQAKSANLRAVDTSVTLAQRWQHNGHRSGILWFTGLSGAGKSTLAVALERLLFDRGMHVAVLDGDNVRQGLSADLGFSPADREENIRRVGEVAALMARAGMIVVTAFISPYRADRDRVRAIAPDLFHEVHVHADLAVCETRDPKGLYRKARAGQIAEFTGISAPYEAPERPELIIDTGLLTVEQSLDRLLAYVRESFIEPL
ncbi:MAG: adenylyl-sulfate kinase [Thalassobaculales bacterium]